MHPSNLPKCSQPLHRNAANPDVVVCHMDKKRLGLVAGTLFIVAGALFMGTGQTALGAAFIAIGAANLAIFSRRQG